MGMAAFLVGSTIVGTALSVRGQMQAGEQAQKAGEAAKQSGESQAQLADYNAAVADLQAQDALVRGDQDAQRFRVRTRGIIGEQRAGFAAGNIDVGYGSTVDVQADSAFLGELDALTAKTNAAREAWGFRIEGTDLRKRAEILRKEGANALSAGVAQRTALRWGAAGTVFSASTSLLEARYGFGRK